MSPERGPRGKVSHEFGQLRVPAVISQQTGRSPGNPSRNIPRSRMKPDSMLVEPEHIISARQDVSTKGGGEVLNEIASTEPALASFIYEGLATVAGKLCLSGAPTPLVQGSHEDVLSIVLTCVQALRRGHFELWKDTMAGTRLAQLDPSIQSKPRRRRKKPEGESPAPEEGV
jgi:hypothetical protein